MIQVCGAANELEISIITGHTGTYDALSTVVGTCTAYGTIRRDELITPGGAKPGDHLFCTKPLGLETLTNFALTHKKTATRLFGSKAALNLSRKITMQTCVKEALQLAKTEGVTAMHDATEGGLAAALNEVADASDLGFTVYFGKLQLLPEMEKLAKHFQLTREQVLSVSSTGTLLVAASPRNRERVVEVLSRLELNTREVGVFTESKQRLMILDGKEISFPKKSNDPYAKIMSNQVNS